MWYICEKCELRAAFLGGESFGDAFWKSKVNGTQNFVHGSKSTLKVAKPTIENRKNHEISIEFKIWSRCIVGMRIGAKHI